jgi:hypothetical protein
MGHSFDKNRVAYFLVAAALSRPAGPHTADRGACYYSVCCCVTFQVNLQGGRINLQVMSSFRCCVSVCSFNQLKGASRLGRRRRPSLPH